MADYYSGQVHSVIFENPDQAFYILRMILDGEVGGPEGNAFEMSDVRSVLVQPYVTIRGTVPGIPIKAGTWFGFEGAWKDHKKFGKQIQISKAPILKDGWDAEKSMRVLISNGVGAQLCATIFAHVGADSFVDAVGDVEVLKGVPGVTPLTANYVMDRWNTARAHFNTLSFLGELKIPKGRIKNIWRTFGDDAENILVQNPWALVRIDGITFKHADAVAVQLGIDLETPLRLKGAVLYLCKSQKGMGHLYIRIGQVCSEVRAEIPTATDKQIGQVLAELHKDEFLILDRKTRPGETAIYEPWLHYVEKKSAELLRDRVGTARYGDEAYWAEEFSIVGPKTKATFDAGSDLSEVVKAAVDEWSDAGTVHLSDTQKQGVVNALYEPVSILTGLPGTGKTTSLLIAVKILRELGVQFQLVAPTGIAAKKLTEATMATAGTLHRTFSAKGGFEEERDTTYEGIVGKGDGVQEDGSDQYWGYSEAKPHPALVLICDESSMLDQNLLYRMLSCTNEHCRLVFVGDAAQLPSVGPGNVLRDLIASKKFPVVALTEIFRQEETSDIILAAHAIHAGQFPQVGKKSDFVLIENAQESEVLGMVLAIAQRFQDKGFDFQILSPRHSGTVGVTNMNGRIRELLNPQQPGLKELRLDSNTIIRENDRVMVVKNNYRHQIFNGDVGRVTRIDHSEKVLLIEIHETLPRLVELEFSELSTYIRMAYACTIHKCLQKGTRIWTQEGLKAIEEISTSDQVMTRKGLRFVTLVSSLGKKETLKITTSLGREILATPEHRFLVGDSWVEAANLKPGMALCVPLGSRSPGKENISVGLAELLGALVSDGCYTDQQDFRVEFTNKNERWFDWVVSLVEKELGVSLTIRSYRGCQSFYFHSKEVRGKLFGLGVGYTRGPQKTIPAEILKSASPIRAAFLRGLFDGDGYVSKSKNRLVFATSSGELAQEVQLLLLDLGIVARKVVLKSSWQVYVLGRWVQMFQDQIGFSHPEKKEKLQNLVKKIPQKRWKSNGDHIHAMGFVRGYRDRKGVRGATGDISKRISSSLALGFLTRETALVLEPEIPELSEYLKNFYDGIVSVGPQKRLFEVFELEVDGVPEYLAEGCVSHNSQGLEYDYVVVPVLPTFHGQLQRNLYYTAITRAKKKVVLVGTAAALDRAIRNNREDHRNTLFLDRLEDLIQVTSG